MAGKTARHSRAETLLVLRRIGRSPRDTSYTMMGTTAAPLTSQSRAQFLSFASDVEIAGELRMLLDEGVALLRLAAHQVLDQGSRFHRLASRLGVGRMGHVDLEQRPLAHVHRRLAQMDRLHLAQPLE